MQMSFRGLAMGQGSDVIVRRVDGLFERSMNLLTPDLPRYHGGLVGVSYHAPRVVDMELVVSDPTVRRAVLAAFGPSVDTEYELTFQLADEPEMAVFCRPDQVASRVDALSEVGVMTVDVQLVAADPAIYSSQVRSAVILPFAPSAGLSYPVIYPKSYGVGGSGVGTVLDNAGDWDTWPILRIAGPVSGTLSNPVVEFVSQDTKLDFSANGGTQVGVGQTLVVDTHPARRSVAFATGQSRYGRLTVDSVWTPLSPGSNEVRFRASGDTGGAAVTVEWRDAWI